MCSNTPLKRIRFYYCQLPQKRNSRNVIDRESMMFDQSKMYFRISLRRSFITVTPQKVWGIEYIFCDCLHLTFILIYGIITELKQFNSSGCSAVGSAPALGACSRFRLRFSEKRAIGRKTEETRGNCIERMPQKSV